MPVVESPVQTYRIERFGASTSQGFFEQVALLHADSIHGGIMGALGPNFVATLYLQLNKRSDVLMFAALREDRAIGFVAGSSNVRRSLRNIGIAGFGALAVAACANAWRPRILWKLLQTTGYFYRRTNGTAAGLWAEAASDPARAELLAIAVAKEARGQGVGKALMIALEHELHDCSKTGEYFVSTNREEIESNAFYRASGFTLVGEKRHHDLTLNIYKKELAA